MSSQKLWVQHQTTAKTYGPTQIPIKDCPLVDDFLKEIKKEFEIPGPACGITLSQLKDGHEVEIKPSATLQSLGNAGKDGDAPLIVIANGSAREISEIRVTQNLSTPRKKAFIERLQSCLYYTCFTVNGQHTRCCVTAYSKHRLATFSHGPHASFQVGSIVPIYAVNDNSKFEARVFHVDNELDYICSIAL